MILLALSRTTWLPYLISITLITPLAIFTRRKIQSDIWLVFIILVLLSVLFHVFIVGISADPKLDLMRYVMCAYPAIIAGSLAIISKLGGKKMLTVIAVLFMAASFSTNFSVPYWNQSGTTLAVLKLQKGYVSAMEIAMEYGDTIIVPHSEIKTLSRPGLGYVDSPYPVRTIEGPSPALSDTVDYTVIIPHSDRMSVDFLEFVQINLPSTSVLEYQSSVIEGEFMVDLYRITSAKQ